MSAGDFFMELFEWSAPTGGALRTYDFGYTHFCVDVSDIDAEHERLAALGMTFVHPSAVRFGRMSSV